jgi:dolichol kinase
LGPGKIEARFLLCASKLLLNAFHNVVPIAVTAIAVALAAYLLLIRDRLVRCPEMSKAERDRAIRQNRARKVHWSHIILLIAAVVAVVLNFRRTGHQPPWAQLAEIAIVAILVFKYYRDRSEDRIEKPHQSGKA